MKKKNTVLLLGIASIMILISVQVYIIIGVWKEKNEMFTLRYTQLSQEGAGYIRWTQTDNGFGLVRDLLNDTTDRIIKQLFEIKDEQELEQRKKGILEYYNAVLQREQVLSGMLATYFGMRGFDTNFKHTI